MYCLHLVFGSEGPLLLATQISYKEVPIQAPATLLPTQLLFSGSGIAVKDAQVLRSLVHLWGIRMELYVPDFRLAHR